jgi:hypothetical protein
MMPSRINSFQIVDVSRVREGIKIDNLTGRNVVKQQAHES